MPWAAGEPAPAWPAAVGGARGEVGAGEAWEARSRETASSPARPDFVRSRILSGRGGDGPHPPGPPPRGTQGVSVTDDSSETKTPQTCWVCGSEVRGPGTQRRRVSPLTPRGTPALRGDVPDGGGGRGSQWRPGTEAALGRAGAQRRTQLARRGLKGPLTKKRPVRQVGSRAAHTEPVAARHPPSPSVPPGILSATRRQVGSWAVTWILEQVLSWYPFYR